MRIMAARKQQYGEQKLNRSRPKEINKIAKSPQKNDRTDETVSHEYSSSILNLGISCVSVCVSLFHSKRTRNYHANNKNELQYIRIYPI